MSDSDSSDCEITSDEEEAIVSGEDNLESAEESAKQQDNLESIVDEGGGNSTENEQFEQLPSGSNTTQSLPGLWVDLYLFVVM